MSAFTIDQWNQSFNGGDNGIEMFRSKPVGFQLDLDTAYVVRVREAKVVKSGKGDVQLQIDFDVLDGDEKLGEKREWLTLPKQASDIDLGRERAEKATQRRFDDMLSILNAAWPKDYAPYAEKVEGAGKAQYKDFEGKLMDSEAFTARNNARKTKCVAFTDALHGRVEEEISELEGTSLWLVKATNTRDERYPYTNFYSTKPSKVPVFSKQAEGEASTPF